MIGNSFWVTYSLKTAQTVGVGQKREHTALERCQKHLMTVCGEVWIFHMILWWKVTIHKRKCRVLICKKSPKWRAWTAVILPAVRWRAVLHGTENTLIFHRIARISEYIYILTECTATVQYISMNII